MKVIKIGGASGISLHGVVADLARLHTAGERIVLVHGGSDATNRMMETMGHKPRFVTSRNGQVSRVTDREVLEIYAAATALVNRRLVESLQRSGTDAVGLSGADGRLIEADRKSAIRIVEDDRQRILRDQWTGRPRRVRTALLSTLINHGHVPVIAPLAISARGELLNIDGDRAAAAVAGALAAESLVILTRVPGLLRDRDDPSTLVSDITSDELESAMAYAAGRMRKKVLGAQEALERGVPRVIIASSEVERPVASALSGAGTVLHASRREGAGEAAS